MDYQCVEIPSPDPASLTWYLFDPPQGAAECPEWLRSAAIDKDGTTWACAAFVHQVEPIAVLRAGLEQEPVVVCDGHFYLRIRWMRAKQPQYETVFQHFEAGVTQAFHSGGRSTGVH